MKYLSIFSGIGGFELGLQNSKHDFECVGYSEIDKYARSIYEKHFPKHTYFGDATKIKTEDLPNFDFLVGGFPCQAFSLAGKRRGFDDTRGTLFFEIARILKDKKPRYFLLENVRGLLHHNKGETFKTILKIFSNLGYYVKWQVLNSKDFGVPQRRERIFIGGYSRRECGGEVLSFRRKCKKDNGRIQQCSEDCEVELINCSSDGNIACIDANYHKGLSPVDIKKNRRRRTHILEKKPLKIRETTKKGYKEAYPYDGVLTNRGNRKTAKGIVRDQHCGCLQTTGVWGTVTDDFRIRKLTPKECERLQGFPDDWTKFGKDDELISDTQRYKCIGNAVTTTVITAIVNEVFKDYEKH